MSTHAKIYAKLGPKIHVIYLHNCDFPGHTFSTLLDHYNTEEKITALVELGDLSSLGESTDKPEGHSFANQIDGYCVSYHRDRGEPWERNHRRLYYSLDRAKDKEYETHNFYHDGESWTKI